MMMGRALPAILLLTLLPSAVAIQDIDDFITGVLGCTDATGLSLAIVKDGTVNTTKGYGLKNIDTEETVNERTMFVTASLTKAFVATTIAKTIEENPTINWNSKVHDLLPEVYFSDPHRTQEATIKDLLSHRMGLAGHNVMRIAGFSIDELMERLAYLPFYRDFREGYDYNNLMYGLASYIVNDQYDKAWEQVADEKLFTPLGMDDTTFVTLAKDRWDEFAISYGNDNGNLREIPMDFLTYYYGTITAPGAVSTNAVDMAKWLNFQLSYGKNSQGQSIVPENLMKDCHVPSNVLTSNPGVRVPTHEHTRSAEKVAKGWFEGHYREMKLHTHSGGIAGYTSLISLLPDQNMGVYVAVNGPVPGNTREYIHMFITDVMLGKQPWVDLTLICGTLDAGENRRKRNANEEPSEFMKEETGASRRIKRALSEWEGTYGHFAYGNLTVFHNTSTDALNMRYGERALFELIEQNPDEYLAQGLDSLWQSRYSMTFTTLGGVDQVTVNFDFLQPSVFIKDLKQSDAPPPPEICPDTTSGAEPVVYRYTVTCLISLLVLFKSMI